MGLSRGSGEKITVFGISVIAIACTWGCVMCYCCRSVAVVSSDEVLSKELLRSRGIGVIQCFTGFDPHE